MSSNLDTGNPTDRLETETHHDWIAPDHDRVYFRDPTQVVGIRNRSNDESDIRQVVRLPDDAWKYHADQIHINEEAEEVYYE